MLKVTLEYNGFVKKRLNAFLKKVLAECIAAAECIGAPWDQV
jgi:hypothetical protein